MKPWYETAFGDFYLELYSYRDQAEAERVLDLAFSPDELRGEKVIDVACGAGRYLEELACRGAWAMGVDLSPPLLRAAHARNARLNLARADMRAIPLADGAVDWALSLFTSFGYFESSREHRELATELARVARRGVVVDIPNPRFLEQNLVRRSSRVNDAKRIEEERRLAVDPSRVIKRVRIYDFKGKLLHEYEERVMLFSQTEFLQIFESAGLSVVRMHGDYEGSAFDEETSPRQLGRFEITERVS